MEKELFVSTLREKAGVDNASDRSYSEVYDMYADDFADDAKITDESWAKPVRTIQIISGQSRHDTSVNVAEFKAKYTADAKDAQQKAINDAVAKFKAQWEKDHKTEDAPKEKESVDIDIKISDAISKAVAGLTGEDSAFGKLSKQFNDFIANAAKEKKEAFVADTRKTLKTYLLDDRGADREPVVNLVIRDMAIDENCDIDKLKIDVEKKYEKLYKELYGDSQGAPFAGGAGGKQNTAADAIKAWAKDRQGVMDEEAKAAESLAKHFA